MYIYGKDIIGIRETSQGPKQIGKKSKYTRQSPKRIDSALVSIELDSLGYQIRHIM